jgi:hypothetical protein
MITEKVWLLPAPYTDDDLDWIAKSNLQYHIYRPYNMGPNDSGWCDYNTGAEVITNSHKIYLKTETEKEEMWLKLKYIDRVTLYNINTHDGQFFN